MICKRLKKGATKMDEKKKEKIVKFFRQMLSVYDFQLVIDINKDLENVFRLNDIQT